MDVKWILRKYFQFLAAKQITERAFESLNQRVDIHSNRINQWIHGQGGSPNSQPEAAAIKEVEYTERALYLKQYIRDLDIIINAINQARSTLTEAQQLLIKLRYFERREVNDVVEALGLLSPSKDLNIKKYYQLHSEAMEDLSICLSSIYTVYNLETLKGYLLQANVSVQQKQEILG
jgi:hypothetical protein